MIYLDRWVALAEVARPHGVRGELRLKVYNLESDLLLCRPTIRLLLAGGEVRREEIRSVRRVPGAMLIALASVSDRNQAEALRGARIEVPREALGDAGDGEYFHCDLEGCEVRLDGVLVGKVSRVLSYKSCDTLQVVRDRDDIEVPFTAAFIERVDVDARTIVVSALPDAPSAAPGGDERE